MPDKKTAPVGAGAEQTPRGGGAHRKTDARANHNGIAQPEKVTTHQRENDPRVMLEAATAYAARGWCVFPIRADGDRKRPLTKHGFKDATTDLNKIRQWWLDKWPGANIGIATGEPSGLIVLDTDDYKPEFQRLPGAAPATVQARTGGGGHHYLFRRPDGQKYKSGAILPAVDSKADGGYIVAPPSLHASGCRYEWVDGAGPDDCTPADAPPWLVELIERAAPQPASTRPAAPAVTSADAAAALAPYAAEHDPWMDAATTREQAAAMVAAIPAEDRETWLRVGMALHDMSGGAWFDVWDAWSRTCPDKYDAGDQQTTWEHFGRGDGERVTEGTLRHLAAQHGWKPAASHDHAASLTSIINARTCALLGMDPRANADAARAVSVNPERVRAILSGAFWSGRKSKLFVLNRQDVLVQCTEKDARHFLLKSFGPLLDRKAVERYAVATAGDKADKLADVVMRAAHAAVMDALKYSCQRENVEWHVDMFAQESRMEMREDSVRVVLTHQPYAAPGAVPNVEAVADFKAHFPMFDEFLCLLVMSRFASDRKNAYLWMWCDSDWGKSFLLKGVLGPMRLVVETSAKEIEAAFEGKPVGRRPADFKRAIVLAVNEFKSIKSEMKQLESEMQLAPKNELTATVELYTKLFTSAEQVNSLVTDAGIEDQFANRFNLIRGSGSLRERPLFKSIGKAAYASAVLHYAAERLNAEVAQLRAKGRIGAATAADEWLEAFHAAHGIGTFYQTVSQSLEAVAEDALRWCRDQVQQSTSKSGWSQASRFIRNKGEWHLTCAGGMVSRFIDECVDESTRVTVRKRKQDLMRAMSADGSGNAAHRIGDKGTTSIKSIWLKPWPGSGDD